MKTATTPQESQSIAAPFGSTVKITAVAVPGGISCCCSAHGIFFCPSDTPVACPGCKTGANLGSPEAIAARHIRINAATVAANARYGDLAQAKALIRKHQIKSVPELLDWLQCLQTNVDPAELKASATLWQEHHDLGEYIADLDARENGD